MVTIQNGILTAKFQEQGAELKSLVFNGTEYIWPGDPAVWQSSAPLMFPVCGRLMDDEYMLNGEQYSLQTHGYARFCIFQIECLEESSVTFFLRSDEESRKLYPFDYELRVTYTLEEKSLRVRYDVKNLSGDTMYFSIGGHEGYFCPEGIEEYDVILPVPETLDRTVLEGNYLGYEKLRVLENSDTLALKYDYFTSGALVFMDMKAKSAVLKNRRSGRAVRVSFDGFDYFQLWTKPGAPYICLEPWCGIADRTDTDKNLKTKEGILQLPVSESLSREHRIEILK